HPLKDDKILTDWNGLMIVAYAKAGIAFNNESFIKAAEKSSQFILNNLKDTNGRLIKRYRNGVSGLDAHLDDYAFIIWGLLELYEATFKTSYLSEAIELNKIMIEEFWSDDGGFYLGSDKSEQLIVRALTGYDGAIPSGNSIAAYNLLKLTRLTGEVKFAKMAEQIFKVFSNEIENSPTGYTSILSAFMFELSKPKEIVVVGSSSSLETQSALNILRSKYIPNKVILFKDTDDKLQSLTSVAKWTSSHKMINKKTTYYICEDFSCKLPTTDIGKALKLINE
ncbi:MAG: thioredoxin domain-containing protein, partial [Fidelibacterota bacterium]